MQTEPSSDRGSSPPSLRKLWALATVPVVVVTWGAALAGFLPSIRHPAVLYWLAVLAGTLWLSALSLRIICREEGNLRWTTLQQRLWLKRPEPPSPDQPRQRVGCRMLLSLLLMAVWVLFGALFSALAMIASIMLPVGILWPPQTNIFELASPEYVGHWWWAVVVMASWAVGALLGEELFFRGVLLPRMAAAYDRRVCARHALVYAVYGLYRPAMIPFRFLEGLAIAGPALRFRNNRLALAVRSVEGVGLLALLLAGHFTLPSLRALQSTLTLPNITGHPAPLDWSRGKLDHLPRHDPNSGKMWQVDLRSNDLSALDLRPARDTLLFADFDSRTRWPAPDRMPDGFDVSRIMELGKNPGLGLRQLHAQGIAGQGVGIGIIDRCLQTTHREYAERLRWYETICGAGTRAQMHGSAVASIAVGKTVGVAPEADLYYLAIPDEPQAFLVHFHCFARGVRRLLEINRHLPPERRIRVISMSIGWSPIQPGYHDFQAAAEEAKRAGLLVISSSVKQVHGFRFHGLGRSPLSNPDELTSYERGLWWTPGGLARLSGHLLVPMDSRTTASPTGENDYVFYRQGGWSWSIPYIAGLYALAAQVDPGITPDRFWSLALQTGREIQIKCDGESQTLGRIADPAALITALKQARSASAPHSEMNQGL
jgi:membrane protease YdiL (CAAX protease family)